MAPIPSHTLPSIDDVESWPEVGQASSTHSRESNGPVDTNEKDEGEREHERERSHSQGTSRKSEKTKWIPIPPEELRAAHDAQRPNRTQHTRNRSAHHSRTQGGAGGSGSPSASGSVSGQTSQGQSRTHSSVGMRPAPSHASSVSHSQAQSRTGSVHSSPRQLSMRGGRRLPEEGIVTGSSGYSSTAFNASTLGPGRSMKSSGTSSPQVLGQPLPIPSLEFTPSIGYQAPNMTPGSRASSNPVQITPEVSNGTTYYPTHIPPNLAVPAYHSPRPTGSPVANPYALPMMGPVYPQASVAPALPVQPGYATPRRTAPGSAVGPPAEGGVPPATMIVRPPPPNESDAVAGYRDVGFALPSPVTYVRRDEGEVAAAGETVERGRRARELSFGSIGIPGASKSPSPAPVPPSLQARMAEGGGGLGLDVGVSVAQTETAVVEEETEESMEKAFEKFTVGVGPGEPVPARIKSKTRTQSKGRKLDELSVPSEHSEPLAEAVNAEDNGDASEGAEAGAKVIDLTDPETKWEFGTTHHGEQAAKVEKASASPSLSVPIAVGAVPNKIAVPYVPVVVIPPTVPNNLPTPFSPSDVPSSALSTSDAVTTDEWEVKDYGWGFGRGGPPTSSYQPPILRDDRGVRDRERREFQDKQSDREYHGRPRRGSYGGYGYDRGGPERGGYSGRRGRGGFGGRGYHNRSYSRGGYQGQQQQRPPFTVTQPPLPPPSDINGYYAPPPQLATYIPSGYDGYPYAPYAPAPVPVPAPQTAQSPSQSQQVPPMPMPQSVLSFPLDPTRYYLLGQLEYYLSPQNIVQDFFLRQRMDSRGWISIPLIASFNRVKQLTVDLQLVRDVLSLSSLVEVRGDWVRMREWEHFVLPNAVRSTVEESHSLTEGSYASPGAGGEGGHTEDSGEAEALGHDDDEEEEEEDVVFVLG
ncbi:hypothetical protein A0H81_02447 [Grifola frondosa]|uniref:HTH La-type RNA-binding domain-containing protein n=1 Tax=Grifola frondosa TaxID=5627 RepID=A0A1C7MN75_GRIFR|nr:hypothetical protein A0H81_02447 [Grifola frondosa]